MENPLLISIIIPVYNVEPYIERCLLSVLNQSYSNLEVILIDDCTPDNSISIAQEVISRYPDKENIHIIKHEKNGGLSAARNTGIKAATGDYLYFLDSDDEITPDAIQKLTYYAINNSNVDVIIGGVEVIGNYPAVKLPFADGSILSSNKDIQNSFFKNEWYVMAWNKLVKRSFVFDNSLLFYSGIYHEDLLWSFEVAQKAQSLIICTEKIYKYYIRSSSIAGSVKPKNIQDYLFVFSKMIERGNINEELQNNKLYVAFLESTRFYVLTLCKTKKIWNASRVKMLELYPVFFSSLLNRELSIETKIKIIIQILPSNISYFLFRGKDILL